MACLPFVMRGLWNHRLDGALCLLPQNAGGRAALVAIDFASVRIARRDSNTGQLQGSVFATAICPSTLSRRSG